VVYVKTNAIAGREFSSWAELESHLVRWTREVADLRLHGTTGEAPLERFVPAEAQVVQPLPEKPSWASPTVACGNSTTTKLPAAKRIDAGYAAT
jgi:hypothetical protein